MILLRKGFKSFKSKLDKQDKSSLIYLVFFSIIISLIEIIGVAAILPFLSIVTDFNYVHENKILSWIYNLFHFEHKSYFIVFIGFFLVLFYLIRGLLNYYYDLFSASFTHLLSHKLAAKIYSNHLNSYLKNFVNQNISTLMKLIIHETSNYTSVVSAFLLILSEGIIAIIIYLILLFFDFRLTLILTLLLTFNSALILNKISKKIKIAGQKREIELKRMYNFIKRSFGDFKFIKVKSLEKEFSDLYYKYGFKYSLSNIENAKYSNYPKIFLETISFSLIVIMTIYLVVISDNLNQFLPTISLFVISLYRLMPSLNRLLNSYNKILFFESSTNLIDKNLSLQKEDFGNVKIVFNNKIQFSNVDFKYKKNEPILNQFDFIIEKGQRIGIHGESGSGKSTILNILMGFLMPDSGNLLIDDVKLDYTNLKSWRKLIGYIPQNIYLFEGTLGENISFTENFDEARIMSLIKILKLETIIDKKVGLKTIISEEGGNISGGQKQRIAIARALYYDPEIILIDEGTSALDYKLEDQLMDEIIKLSKNKTLIVIAHRLKSLSKCNKVYEMKNNRLNECKSIN